MHKYELYIEFKNKHVTAMTLPNIADFWTDKSFLIVTNLMGMKYFIPLKNIMYYNVKKEKAGEK